MEITSIQNPKVKEWSALLTRKGRDEQGRYLLEGVHLVKEALAANVPLDAILYTIAKDVPEELPAERLGAVELIAVSDQVLAKCSETGTPQGVVAVARRTEPVSPESLWARPDALLVAVDGVQDPGNLGTIIRSADAVGATGVVLGKGTVDLYNPKTLRATMGSLFHLPVIGAELGDWLQRAAAGGVQVVGTSLAAERSCYELDLSKPTCFVVGNEARGVSPAVEALVTERVIIPMPGRAESLNVAMATTVLLFEAVRQRGLS
jgi:TrmH family RNA methyltransferase